MHCGIDDVVGLHREPDGVTNGYCMASQYTDSQRHTAYHRLGHTERSISRLC